MLRKKFVSVVVGVCVAMLLAILPLGAWTTADAATPVELDIPVQPRYGGQADKTFNFNGGHITVSLTAENWIWPGKDNGKVTIESNSSEAYYGFEVKFIWTNDTSKGTVWRVPTQYNSLNNGPLMILQPNAAGIYTITLDKNCNGAGLSGSPGQSWACEQINVVVSVRIGNEPVQTYTFAPVHF